MVYTIPTVHMQGKYSLENVIEIEEGNLPSALLLVAEMFLKKALALNGLQKELQMVARVIQGSGRGKEFSIELKDGQYVVSGPEEFILQMHWQSEKEK